jgi:hypothetical protein
MDFRSATNALFERIPHEMLARALGTSVAGIRQARLKAGTKAHRAPPKNWEDAVISLAEDRIRHYHQLIGEMGRARRVAGGGDVEPQ